MVSKAHRGMMHVPRGGRPPWGGGGDRFRPPDRWVGQRPMPPWGGGGGWQRPMPPWQGGGGWGRPRPPWHGGGWGRPTPPWHGGGWGRPRPPFGPFGGGPADGGWGRPRRPWGANPFNPFGPRRHSKAIEALIQAQRDQMRETFNKNPYNLNMPQKAMPTQGVAEAVPAPTTTYADRLPPPRPPRIAVDPPRFQKRLKEMALKLPQRGLSWSAKNKGGLMKRRQA